MLRSASVPIGAYLATRVLLLVLTVAVARVRHVTLTSQITNEWDDKWYLQMAGHGFPRHVSGHYSALGFFPLYSAVTWAVSRALFCPLVVAGLLVSFLGGLVAVVLVQRLTSLWWGASGGHRAAVLFSLFPGSVVFSMVYSECLLLPLVAGCLLALHRRRYVLAGLLAALATATAADGLVLVLVCAVAAFLEVRRLGWVDPLARRSLLAPLLAPLGAVAFALYLWRWTGTPFATYDVQRAAWNETTSVTARLHEARELIRLLPRHFRGLRHRLNLNRVSDLAGALYLFVAFAVLVRKRVRPPAVAMAWVIGIAVLTLTSTGTAPNPRLLLTAFPLATVWGTVLRTGGYVAACVVFAILLAGMSVLTFYPAVMRP